MKIMEYLLLHDRHIRNGFLSHLKKISSIAATMKEKKAPGDPDSGRPL